MTMSSLIREYHAQKDRLRTIERKIRTAQINTPTCCVVDQFCDSPANLEIPIPARGICFSCGSPVCMKCSTKRKYYNYGRQRLCNTCQIRYDGNDILVTKRIYRMAGYSAVQLGRI